MINLDTHIVIELLAGRLRSREVEALKGEGVGVSGIVIWELAKLEQLGRISVGPGEPRVQAFLASCTIWPITVEIAVASTKLDFRGDHADELIAATSVIHQIPLLTRDKKILGSKLVPLSK